MSAPADDILKNAAEYAASHHLPYAGAVTPAQAPTTAAGFAPYASVALDDVAAPELGDARVGRWQDAGGDRSPLEPRRNGRAQGPR